MNRRLEDLWAGAADDGASAPVGVIAAPPDPELDELLAAWSKERSRHIEGALLLKEARRLLMRLLTEGGGTGPTRQRTERLIRLIRRFENTDR